MCIRDSINAEYGVQWFYLMATYHLTGVPPPGGSEPAGLALVIIDPQVDFHPPSGSLAVPGAVEDTERIAELLDRHQDKIDRVVVSLDTHHVLHIANPGYWRDREHHWPAPFTTISAEDIKNGSFHPADESNASWALQYAEALEADGRFKICIWPEHCLIGTVGHTVQPVLLAALERWAHARLRTVEYVLKGLNNRTEMYSALKAEVPVQDDPGTQLNTKLTRSLHDSTVVVCGQAKSHCVNYTMRDLLAGWEGDPARLVLLSDGCSAVPGFEASANEFEADMKAAGVTVTTCADFSC
eukprot:TRINITY_DN2753_c0_g1_i9.p1 TRINITY_DN2753_c0_g1~~TRINITY_DN2753_c0_g1_i9.p1  ORF type:complete len:298 (+),score=65.56 TRINITY_DN2753_c0_g1_i9:153-1046(+)